MERSSWDTLGVRIGALAVGVVGCLTILYFLFPPQESDVPQAPKPAVKAPRRLPPAGSAASGDPAVVPPPAPTPEENARTLFQIVLDRQTASLREKLPIPRPGAGTDQLGKTFHAELVKVHPFIRQTARLRAPFTAEVLFEIDWYCDGKPAPRFPRQAIEALYEFKDGQWVFLEARRKAGAEFIETPDERAWIKKLFE